MASNNINDEKPNLRPTKRLTASGKSIFLHHNPNQPSVQLIVCACQIRIIHRSDTQQQPHVEYSLNKQQRWKILNDDQGSNG